MVMSDLHKQRISQALKGRRHTKERIAKISISKKGQVPWNKGKKGYHVHTKESKAKLSKWNDEYWNGEGNNERRKQHGERRKGIPRTDEVKRKCSLANMGKHPSEETKRKISISRKRTHQKRPFTKEQLEKMSQGHKRYFAAHPEALERFMKAPRGFKGDTNLEKMLQEVVADLGFNFTKQFDLGFTVMDVAIPDYKIAIFADGCYWHACPLHYPDTFPKIRAHDSSVNKRLQEQGWHVIRLWGHDFSNKLQVTNLLCSFLNLKPKQILTLDTFV